MEALSEARQVLESMVTQLGFEVNIEQEESEEGACLQILTEESGLLIGKHGDRLDDLQYLVNRILQKKVQEPPRVRIDCDHFRVRQEEKLIAPAKDLAEKAKESGKSMKMRPLNAYHRRIVHNALVDDGEIETFSPRSDERLKRIVIRPVS